MKNIAVVLFLPVFIAIFSSRALVQPPEEHVDAPNEKCYCKAVINEVNTASPVGKTFLELRLIYTTGKRGRKPYNDLNDYYVSIVRGDPPASVFFVNLGNHNYTKRDGSRFFVLGNTNVANVDLTFNNDIVQSVCKNEGDSNSIPVGDDSPYAVLLLYSTKKREVKPLELFSVNGTYVEHKLTAADMVFIRPHIVDMIVYGRKVPVSQCDVFDIFWPDSVTATKDVKYIIRDWDAGERDFSLNRCTVQPGGFKPESFIYDEPSPGENNPCKGSRLGLIVEDVIDDIAPMAVDDEEVNLMATCSASVLNVPAGRYSQISEKALSDIRKCCTETEEENYGTDVSIATDTMNIQISNAEIVEKGGSVIKPQLKTLTLFNPEWIPPMRQYFSDDGAILESTSVQEWLRFNIPGSNDRPMTFYCDACNNVFKEQLVDVKHKHNIMTSEGYYYHRPYTNRWQITQHEKNPVHLAAIKYAYQKVLVSSDEELDNVRAEFMKQFEATLEPTVRIIRTVYTEVLADVSFSNHEKFVDLQTVNGLNVGFLQYSKKAATTIALSISETMHLTLLQYLVKQDKPLSVVVDATTNVRNIPFLIVYFQTIEDGYPISYFYRNIELKGGESAKETFKSFWDLILLDEKNIPSFEAFLVRRIKYLVTDNAAVMVGKKNSFLVELQSKLNRTITSVGCMAHKMSLVLKHAIRDKNDEDLKFVFTLEKNINSFYIFYASRGSKRFQHLTETADEYGFTLYRFRKNIEIRWSTAEKRVIESIVKNEELVEKDLKEIMLGENTFNQKAIDSASELYLQITDISINLVYNEFLDFLTINSILSLSFQQKAGILLDHYESILQAINNYENLAKTPGLNLNKFVSSCNCSNTCIKGSCTLQQIEDCATPFCLTFELKHNIDPSFRLSNIREKLYNKIIAALNKYFSIEDIKAFRCFDNKQFRHEINDQQMVENFIRACKYLGFQESQCEELSEEYVNYVKNIQNCEMIAKSFQEKSSIFWPMLLETDYDEYKVPENLRVIFEALMIFSDSSAEAERGFSVLNRINSDGRAGLKPETLDALLRIKLNGNKPIKDVKAHIYASKFVEHHARVDDETVRGIPKHKEQTAYDIRVSRLF